MDRHNIYMLEGKTEPKMANQRNWGAVIAITGVLTLLVSILAGIPQIVNFYPNAISGFMEQIPLDIISNWGERVGLLLLGMTVGWFAHVRTISSSSVSIDSIEGCVEVRDIAWKGTGKISNGSITGIDVPHSPVCPDCQSPMNSEEVKRGRSSGIPSRSLNRGTLSGSSTSYFWKCPSSDCGYSSKKDFEGRDDAMNLFKKHFDRITETEDEEYSLDALIEAMRENGDKVTPRSIWRQYDSVVDDSNISTKCFPR